MIHFIPVTLNNVTFCEKKSGGLCFAQHPVSSIGLIVRLTDTLEGNKHVSCNLSWLGQFDCNEAVPQVAFPADVLLAHHAILPTSVCWNEQKKRRPITALFQIWKVHFGPWEILRETPVKIRKVSWKGKTLHFLAQTTWLTHMPLH